ncbi:MAG: peroxiredoxin family protein [Candidatus Omnitrophica bacterium]|nr:peroxiredoxin family protein [Candidatus Omnitrophota bacterium]MCM8794156.1 peroxiredoxin family protein [Candidatus Omnitrophota bacterium]
MVKIKNGQIIPSFRLEDLAGEIIKSNDFSRKKNLVIFFFDKLNADSKRYLEMLNGIYPEVRKEEAEILAICREEKGKIAKFILQKEIKFNVLFDPESKIMEKFLQEDFPTLFITDRFQALYRAYTELPDKREIISSLEFLEKQCPECGITHWPEDLVI